VKIKPENRTSIKRKKAMSKEFHWWLIQEQPRKKGRLAQLTKWNQKLRRLNPKSEFIVKATELESDPALKTS